MDHQIEILFTQAEKEIERRNEQRKHTQPDFRSSVALEQVADEMLYLRAEVKTLRFLFATWAAKK